MCDIVKKVGKVVGLATDNLSLMHGLVHEDNAGAVVLAKTIPPQYYVIKTFWFREEINRQGVKLLKIETVEQLGDMFTKGLAKTTFKYLRKKVMGW